MSEIIAEFAVASCVKEGGIHFYRLLKNGEVTPDGKWEMPEPMYMIPRGEGMIVLLRAPAEGDPDSAVCTYNGAGKAITPLASTKGVVGCHIAASGEDLYCANYVSGSVWRAPDRLVAHRGHGPNEARQQSPHAHGVFLSPDEKYVLACDLGTDEIYVYDRDLCEVSRAGVPAGHGPRHLCFSACGNYVYCITEMGASLCVFSYRQGTLSFLKAVDLKPAGYTGGGKGSAIKMTADGKRLYLTERGSATVVLCAVSGADVTVKGHFPCGGTEPRDISLLAGERFLACANQFSDNVTLFAVEKEGDLTPVGGFSLPAPLCILEVKHENK